MKYYSQIGQDKFLYKKVFKKFEKGTFLDLGAFDGKSLSNTYFFEKNLSWKGWCFEPIPKYYSLLKKNRNSKCFNIGISDKDEKTKFLFIESSPMLSGVVNSFKKEDFKELRKKYKTSIINIKTKKISKFFKENNIKNINYISLDIEGNEEKILNDINFCEVKIDIISVEDNDNLKKVDKILNNNDFILIKQNFFDKIFINKKSIFFKNKFYLYALLSLFQNIFFKSKVYNFIYKYIKKSNFLYKFLLRIFIKNKS